MKSIRLKCSAQIVFKGKQGLRVHLMQFFPQTKLCGQNKIWAHHIKYDKSPACIPSSKLKTLTQTLKVNFNEDYQDPILFFTSLPARGMIL